MFVFLLLRFCVAVLSFLFTAFLIEIKYMQKIADSLAVKRYWKFLFDSMVICKLVPKLSLFFFREVASTNVL